MSTPILHYSTILDLTVPPIPPIGTSLEAYVPAITALRDVPTSLESLVTVGLTLSTLVKFVLPVLDTDGEESLQWFLLETGPADGDNPDQSVQPSDYDLSTNDVHWTKVGGF